MRNAPQTTPGDALPTDATSTVGERHNSSNRCQSRGWRRHRPARLRYQAWSRLAEWLRYCCKSEPRSANMDENPTETNQPLEQQPTRELIAHITDAARALVKEEVGLAKTELRQNIRA